MDGYVFDTSTISACLDASHKRHNEIRKAIVTLDPKEPQYLSAISLAELAFGVRMAAVFKPSVSAALQQVLGKARGYPVVEVSRHTSIIYAQLKTDMAKRYRPDASKKGRPRWLEDWVDNTRGKVLGIDENDLWMCAQAKERALVLVTSDRGMQRISDVDSMVHLLIL